jgi:mRNA interferase MazF
MKQFDIYWVNLDPTIGKETKKTRPCVIIQSNLVNANSSTFLIAPLLPEHKNWPFVVNVSPDTKNNIDKDRHINLKQLRAVDSKRIYKKHGQLDISYKEKINTVIKILFDL